MVWELTDLDERPELFEAARALFDRAGPGRNHAVNGAPERMGQPVTREDLERSLGVLILVDKGELLGALSCCPYSDEQITLWGPVSVQPQHDAAADCLLGGVQSVLKDSPFSSVRVQVDRRNRYLRTLYLRHGLSPWKDNAVLEAPLTTRALEPQVRRLDLSELPRGLAILRAAFPESGHFSAPPWQREQEGYRHYGVFDHDTLVGCAAVQGHGRRSWVSLIAIALGQRSQGLGTRLLSGIQAAEHAQGQRSLGLEVLAENHAALASYRKAGFQLLWTASILSGPL